MRKLLPRKLIDQLENWLYTEDIIVIVGSRQVGKTSLLNILKEHLERKGESVLYIDFEDMRMREMALSPEDFLTFL